MGNPFCDRGQRPASEVDRWVHIECRQKSCRRGGNCAATKTLKLNGAHMFESELKEEINPPAVGIVLPLRRTNDGQFEIADVPRRRHYDLEGKLRGGLIDAIVVLTMAPQGGSSQYELELGDNVGRFLFELYRSGSSGVFPPDLGPWAVRARNHVYSLRSRGFRIETQRSVAGFRYVLNTPVDVKITYQGGAKLSLQTDGTLRAID